MKEQALRNVRILTTMVCLLDLAMLRWHSFIPGLTISALVLMLLEHRRVGQTFRLLESASQDSRFSGSRCSCLLTGSACNVNLALITPPPPMIFSFFGVVKIPTSIINSSRPSGRGDSTSSFILLAFCLHLLSFCLRLLTIDICFFVLNQFWGLNVGAVKSTV